MPKTASTKKDEPRSSLRKANPFEVSHYTGLSIERKEIAKNEERRHYDHHMTSTVFEPQPPKFEFEGVASGFESPNYKGKRTYNDKFPSKLSKSSTNFIIYQHGLVINSHR